MPACKNHPQKKDANLCMGCGSYFCDECGQTIHGIFYCKNCEDTAKEFARTKELEAEYQPRGMAEHDAKWEAGFSSTRMVIINRKNLERIEKPLPLEGVLAGPLRRGFAYLLDWVVVIPKFSFFFYYYLQVGTDRDFKFLLAAEIVTAFFYFLFFNYTTGMTLGKLFASVRLVDASGKQVSIGQAFGRAVFSLISLPFPFIAIPLHGLCSLLTPTHRGFHDLLLATYVVLDEPWKELARREIVESGSRRAPSTE